jgi:hypothetical protein
MRGFSLIPTIGSNSFLTEHFHLATAAKEGNCELLKKCLTNPLVYLDFRDAVSF